MYSLAWLCLSLHIVNVYQNIKLYTLNIYTFCVNYTSRQLKKKRQTKNKKPCALAASLASLYYQPCWLKFYSCFWLYTSYVILSKSLLLSKHHPSKPEQLHFYLSYKLGFHKIFIWKKSSRALNFFYDFSKSPVRVLLACNVWFYDWKKQTTRIFMGHFESFSTWKGSFQHSPMGQILNHPLGKINFPL